MIVQHWLLITQQDEVLDCSECGLLVLARDQVSVQHHMHSIWLTTCGTCTQHIIAHTCIIWPGLCLRSSISTQTWKAFQPSSRFSSLLDINGAKAQKIQTSFLIKTECLLTCKPSAMIFDIVLWNETDAAKIWSPGKLIHCGLYTVEGYYGHHRFILLLCLYQ